MKMISDVARYIRHSNHSRTRQGAARGWHSALEDWALLSLELVCTAKLELELQHLLVCSVLALALVLFFPYWLGYSLLHGAVKTAITMKSKSRRIAIKNSPDQVPEGN
jgi:hypothetical protein